MEMSNIIFSCILIAALSFFSFNLWKIVRNNRLGKSKNCFDQPLRRTKILLKIAFGQTKLFARPASGILHALVYWGFLVITIGTLEMMVDGIFNLDRSFLPLFLIVWRNLADVVPHGAIQLTFIL